MSAGSYFCFRALRAVVRGYEIVHMTRPALGEWAEREASALLLAEAADLPASGDVLLLGCDTGLVGTAAALAAPGIRLTMLDNHCVAVEASRRTLQANRVEGAEVLLSDGAQAVRGRRFDVVLALQPKGRASWEQAVLDAAALLRPGGRFYLAGANRAGIKTAARFAEEVFGHAHVLAYKGGCRVIGASRAAELVLHPGSDEGWRTIEAEAGGRPLRYISKPGLFSWDRLDDGTRLLLDVLARHPLQPDDQVLDVGCGCGALALYAARQAPQGSVIGVDVDCRAVEATQRTLALNEVANGQARLSDCGENVRDLRFSAVVTNPPFHRAQATTADIAGQIIRDAADLLLPGGRLYLVANRFLRYGPVIEGAFGAAEVRGQDSRYTVWYAVKNA